MQPTGALSKKFGARFIKTVRELAKNCGAHFPKTAVWVRWKLRRTLAKICGALPWKLWRALAKICGVFLCTLWRAPTKNDGAFLIKFRRALPVKLLWDVTLTIAVHGSVDGTRGCNNRDAPFKWLRNYSIIAARGSCDCSVRFLYFWRAIPTFKKKCTLITVTH